MRAKKETLLTAFDDLLPPAISTDIPPGFKTVEQLAKERGYCRARMSEILLELIDAKKIQRVKGRTENGRVCWFYGVK